MNLQMGQPDTSHVVSSMCDMEGTPGELKHLSSRRKSNQMRFAHHRAECKSAGCFLYCKAEEGGMAVAMSTDDNEAGREADQQMRQIYGE